MTDAVLFDRKLLNPLHNYLSTMALALPRAKRKGIPVVLYNVSLGPINTSLGRICIKRVLDSSEFVIVRDKESIDMLRGLDLYRDDLKLAADCALNVPLPSSRRLEEIKRTEKIINEKETYLSFNISSYLDTWVKGDKRGIGTEAFTQIISETMDKICNEMGKKVVFVITQPMDLKIAHVVLDKLKYPQNVTLISNKTYSHNELAGILSEVEMHVGMRTHSLIFATSSCTPTIGIIATPKNRGYMKTIEQEERAIEFDEDFTSNNLFALIQNIWENRKEIRQKLGPIMGREKEKARMSSSYLERYLSDK